MASSAHEEPPSEPVTKKQKMEATFVWSMTMIIELISIWGAEYIRLGKGNMSQSNWETIAAELNANLEANGGKVGGPPITVKQCTTKINGLKKTFKEELLKKTSTGSTNSGWAYFEQLAPFLAKTPKMAGIPNGKDGTKHLNVQVDDEDHNSES
jgi:hypothetical protein